MIYEFAFDPASMRSLDALRRVADHCAIHLGRYLSDFPKRRWAVEVRRHIGPQTFRETQQLTETLANLERRGGLIDTGRSYTPRNTWLENALREHAVREFRAIVTEADPKGRDFAISVDALDVDTPPWKIETEPIPRTPEAIVECVAPLFRISQEEILLVDPWFEPDRVRYRESLQALLLAAHADGKSYARLEYHAKVRVDQEKPDHEKQKWIARFKKNCLNLLPKHLPNGAELKIILWCDASDCMHARYVMTERGGIQIDAGLDCGEPGKTTDIYLMSRDHYRKRREELQPHSRAFSRVSEFSIIGSATH